MSVVSTGAGTVLSVTISSVVTPIPRCQNLTPPPLEMGMVETTVLSSVGRERQPTIYDPGEVAFHLEWDSTDATHAFLYTAWGAKTLCAWTIELPDTLGSGGSHHGTKITFSAYVKHFGVDNIEVDKVVMVPVTLQVSGAVTVTPAA